MTDAPDAAARLVEADRRATLARRRLSATVAELQYRLDPARLADLAIREVGAAGHASAEAATRHRGALLGVGGAITLFLLRGRLARLLGRRPSPAAPIPPLPASEGNAT